MFLITLAVFWCMFLGLSRIICLLFFYNADKTFSHSLLTVAASFPSLLLSIYLLHSHTHTFITSEGPGDLAALRRLLNQRASFLLPFTAKACYISPEPAPCDRQGRARTYKLHLLYIGNVIWQNVRSRDWKHLPEPFISVDGASILKRAGLSHHSPFMTHNAFLLALLWRPWLYFLVESIINNGTHGGIYSLP